MYGLITRLTAHPGRRLDLESLLVNGMAEAPGCLSYVVARDAADRNGLWVTEVWTSEAAHRGIHRFPEIVAMRQRAVPLVATMGEPTITEPVGGVGLERG